MPASVGEAVNLEIAAAFPSGVGACHPGAGHALYLEKPPRVQSTIGTVRGHTFGGAQITPCSSTVRLRQAKRAPGNDEERGVAGQRGDHVLGLAIP